AVRFDVSRHDSSGTAAGNVPAAAADAEQIAPTETTLTGDPPASPCAETLRVAVLKLWRSWRGAARTSGPPVAHSGSSEKIFSARGCAASRTFCTTMRKKSWAPRLT